ncbi:T9SS type B sorting domain-containing protein [Mesonia aquimarina]|uniref:T9SS type B sorting domain-containing protein n=1 Tax=Mesonia aquimarina TaxID=1504967 RepID=UPI000EF582CF|nr:gliding motility-associated C-terminal domain-containing protein [Mesonia aquimarina]
MRNKKKYKDILKDRSKIICLRFTIVFMLLFLSNTTTLAQSTLVAEITGNPPDISEWTPVGVDIEGEELVLTTANTSQTGSIFFSQPYNLNQCDKWRVEFDFRIFDGGGADGLAFWYLENPPTDFVLGGSLGLPNNSNGLKVCFDVYDNDNNNPNHNPNPEVQVYYGEGYDETFPDTDMLKAYVPELRSPQYKHAEISWDNFQIEVVIDDEVVLTGVPTPFDGVETILEGYFGFSASTGAITDRHSLKNVQVFIDAIELETDYVQIEKCDQDGDGFEQFDLLSVENQFSTNGEFTYHTNELEAAFDLNPIPDTELTNYTNQEAFSGEIVYVRVENDAGCYVLGEIELGFLSSPNVNTVLANIDPTCDSDQTGEESYDLTQTETIFIDNPNDFQINYFESQADANLGNLANAISSPTNFSVQAGTTETIFLRIDNQGCYEVVALVLSAYTVPQIKSLEQLNTCDNSTGVYVVDLTLNDTNIIGNQNPSTIDISYYLSQVDAENDQNEITDSANFELSAIGCDTIFVKVKNSNQEQCYQISSFEACAIDVLINSPQDLQSCTISDNGLAYFNLTSNNTTILDGQDPSLFDIKYFTSLDDATNNTNEISTPPNYLASNQTQTIFVRLENSQNSTCFDVDSFVIESEKVAVVEAEELTSCVNEDSSSFDLTAIESDLNLSQDRTLVGYYSSLEDAVEDSNKISNPQDFVNSSNVETVYAYVATSQQTCFEVYSIQLVSEVCEPFIPEGFSPNGDGINDVFEISGVLENFPNFRLEIFSRYGQKVYQGNTNKDYWNGTSEAGNDLPTGTYYYILDLNDSTSEVIKGWVYLNR